MYYIVLGDVVVLVAFSGFYYNFILYSQISFTLKK